MNTWFPTKKPGQFAAILSIFLPRTTDTSANQSTLANCFSLLSSKPDRINRELLIPPSQRTFQTLEAPGLTKRHFCYDDNISFVSDPEGLLAIHSGTLVVTAFLPFFMPLMQIVADLFAEDAAQGPAAIICDEMELDTGKREYSVRDRAFPAVARFFTGHYDKADADCEYHGLEPKFTVDVYEKDWNKERMYYWLNSMNLWARR